MTITSEEMRMAREYWGAGKVAISKAFAEGGIEAARKVAEAHIDALYGFNLGPVLFKPTMASGEQTFRPTKDGALAYFVGHSEDFPLDGGFAIQGWTSMESVTAAEFIEGKVGMWMGNIILTDKEGNVTKVDKSFGYKKDENGTLRIIQHHSSLPYEPN